MMQTRPMRDFKAMSCNKLWIGEGWTDDCPGECVAELVTVPEAQTSSEVVRYIYM